jgi:hypothetical protein
MGGGLGERTLEVRTNAGDLGIARRTGRDDEREREGTEQEDHPYKTHEPGNQGSFFCSATTQ